MSKRTRDDHLHQLAEKLKEGSAGLAEAIVAEAEERTKLMQEEIGRWEEEKRRVAAIHVFDTMVTLNVGGTMFITTTATLTRFPDTVLGAMFSGRHAMKADAKTGAFFIDRDGTHFREILNFLRSPDEYFMNGCLLDDEKHIADLKTEAGFYGMKEFMFPASITIGDNQVYHNSDNKLWYASSGGRKVEVVVCDTCGGGCAPATGGCMEGFTTGREIAATQPREACDCCM